LFFLGARPQTPRVGFAEFWVCKTFCEAEPQLLLLFWKRRELLEELSFGYVKPSAKQNHRFCFFSGKEENY
jgi:hypothetical protein